MKSDVIRITSVGSGFDMARKEALKIAAYQELNSKSTILLQLITEEMLSLVTSITGAQEISFWIEAEGKRFELHLSTKADLDKEKRADLLSVASSRKNEAASSFLGYLRDCVDEFLTADVDRSGGIPDEELNDLFNHRIESLEWDGYERSVLKSSADNVKISIRKGTIDITVLKEMA